MARIVLAVLGLLRSLWDRENFVLSAGCAILLLLLPPASSLHWGQLLPGATRCDQEPLGATKCDQEPLGAARCQQESLGVIGASCSL